ncbi:hypothetical protein [Methanobrevibacter curvatus]|uniref:Uncharacterized protein n=1 Tax=Methanobrevibacter curvatus TaxID=49547 RepID=A0A166B6K4_9EURY|nr:hypothetical protein [Methanobrevibacter curvatus]KZX12933.1 hypothetical protein MBCUR_08220 [Methanobrevibacter curvatus]
MNLGKGLAFLFSVIFFFVLVFVLVAIVSSFFPGFHFSDNPIIRIVFLMIFVAITRRFYGYLTGDSDNK